MNFFVEWSRKKAFKAYYVIEANNALENGKETTILPKKKKTLDNLFGGKNEFLKSVIVAPLYHAKSRYRDHSSSILKEQN